MARPNLFEYATSELSQDAVLCWLAAWAAPDAPAEDERLHALGPFIAALLEVNGRAIPAITSLEIRRQYKSIDVLLILNSRLAICIEDKVGSTEHSNQLARYIEGLAADGCAPEDIAPVYVQTFEQGTYAAVRLQATRRTRLSTSAAAIGNATEDTFDGTKTAAALASRPMTRFGVIQSPLHCGIPWFMPLPIQRR